MTVETPGASPEPPEISILMTAFNTAAYVGEAIQSILDQATSRTWELLFVDDGSTDQTLSVLQGYACRFPEQIHVFRHPGGVNCGISASRNLALRHARGTLLTFLDSDDVWLPLHLETQASLLHRLPNITMVYAAAERWVDFSAPFDERASRASEWGHNYLPPLVPHGLMAGPLERGRLLQWFRADEAFVPCICTVMLRTAAARAVGGFCNEFRGLYDDQVFHAKMAVAYDIYAHDVCVARYRQHDRSCCARSVRRRQERKRERERFDSFLATQISSPSLQ